MAKKKESPLKDWTVTVRCVVIKEVYCPNCTEDDARLSVWDMAQDERELEQADYEVLNVAENK